MKEIHTRDQAVIHSEFESLISNKTQIVFVHQVTKQAKKILAKGTAKVKTGTLLILYYPEEFKNFDAKYLCYYHHDGKPLRGFICKPVKKAQGFLGVEFPKEIFEIKRRAYPRVETPNHSTTTFSIKNKQRVMHGTCLDISIGGARIAGDFRTLIHKKATITPLNFTVFQRFMRNEETTFHIPEATVVRSIGDDGVTTEIGITYTLPDDLKEKVQEYIDIRSIEDST